MAEAFRYVCNACRKSIETWTDGNPYYVTRIGRKRYAYHPDHDRLARCIGNDVPHLCLDCGEQFNIDSRSLIDKCPKCDSKSIIDTCELAGKNCPYCKNGRLEQDTDFHCIS